MALGDLFEVVDVQSLQGQDILNIYYYMNVNVEYSSDDLAEWWIAQVLPDIANAQSPDLQHTEVRVRNLFDASDIATQITGNYGELVTSPAETLPRHDAYSFTLYGPGNTTRPGGKRIAGLVETMQTDGVHVGGVLAVLDTLAARLAEYILNDSSVAAFRPTIVARVKEVIGGVAQYRLPETALEAVSQAVVDVAWSLLVSTQNTRKR